MTQNPKLDSPEVEAKRLQLAKAMKDRGRWDRGYDKAIARLPESVLDSLTRHYSSPIHVG